MEPASSFVGRADDLRAIGVAFDEGARLVTLLAPGGMGKTRLALRYAALAKRGFEQHGGSVHVVELASATDASGLFRAMAAAAGATLERSRNTEVVARALGRAIERRKRALYVLDNLEQLTEHAAPHLALWMSQAPDARWIATSRVALDIPGEHVVALGPLELPAEGAALDVTLHAPSIDLFLRRAREVSRGVGATEAELASIGEIVRRTDGIPLAIELAAARLSVLSPAQLLARLSSPLDVLVRRGGAGKHASMRRAVLDSLETLDARERRALTRASVFRGGFSLEAAEAVLGAGKGTLEALDKLVGSSLVRVTDGPRSRRLSLFEVIREQASEDLAAEPLEQKSARLAHVEYLVSRVVAAEARLETTPDADVVGELASDLENLFAAHEWVIGENEESLEASTNALRLAMGAGWVLAPRGEIGRHFELYDTSIAFAAERPETALLLAKAIVARGVARRELGDAEGARAELEDGKARASRLGDARLEALALLRLGEIVETTGSTSKAKEVFAEALDTIARAPRGRPTRLLEAEAHARLGHVARREAELDVAAREIDRALVIYRDCEARAELPWALYEAAVVALFRQLHDEAGTRFREGLELARALGARQAIGAIESGRAILLQELGRLDESLACHTASVETFREMGSRHREASARFYFGAALFERGERTEAKRVLEGAFEAMQTIGMPRYDILISGALAVIAATSGDEPTAARWLSVGSAALEACATEPTLEAYLGIHLIHVEIALGRGDETSIERARAHAARCANDDVRWALRILLSRGADHGEDGRLLVAADGSALRLPAQSLVIDLSRRAPLRRIVTALVAAHAEGSGEALSLDEVVRAGWPGERVSAASGANRVRVALATLRKLGLRDVILTGRGGYYLEPTLRVAELVATNRQND